MTLIEKIQNEISENEIMYATIAKPSHQMANAHVGTIAGLMIALNLVKEHGEVCNWKNNKASEEWSEWSCCGDYSSDCGLEWNISNDDSPSENEMNFCPKCGRKLIEIQPPSEVQSE